MRRNGFMAGMITGSMLGAMTGMNIYRRMSPGQKRSVDKGINKVIDQMTDVLDTLQDMQPFDK